MSEQVIEKKLKLSVGPSLLLSMLLVATCLFAYGYVKQMQTMLRLQSEVQTAQSELTTLKSSVSDAKQVASKSEALVAKQEQMITDWNAAQKGDMNKWYLAEAQYLVRLANDHLQYSHNLGLALTLLQRAQQVLANAQDSNLVDVQKSISNEIANIQAIQSVDTTSLYLRLTALNADLDKLPLPIDPHHPMLTYQGKTDQQKLTPTSWWERVVNHVANGLSKIVIIQENNNETLPITLPDEKRFLYQNLHAQMESAMWATLNQNQAIYQASLARLSAWIQQYFVQSAPTTIAMLQSLQTLRSLNIHPAAPNLDQTVQMLDQRKSGE